MGFIGYPLLHAKDQRVVCTSLSPFPVLLIAQSVLANARTFGIIWMIIPDRQRASGCSVDCSILKTWRGYFSGRISSISVTSPLHVETQFPIHRISRDNNGIIALGRELKHSFLDSCCIKVFMLSLAVLSRAYSSCLICTHSIAESVAVFYEPNLECFQTCLLIWVLLECDSWWLQS